MFKTLAAAACALTIAACGGSDPPARVLTLHSSYDVLAVVRTLPDGVTPSALHPLYFRLDNVNISGGRASGDLLPNGGPSAYAFDGAFDAEGNLTMPIGSAALTGTITETVDALGGRAIDSKPEDGAADELNGYLRTRIGLEIRDGTLLGVAKQNGRPEDLDETKVTIESVELGVVRVAGSAGAVIGNAGVEIFRFRLRDTEPEFTIGQALGDGSFDVRVTGIAEDVFLLRPRVIGKAGDARFFRVVR
jgi:hypothetical protein